MGPVDPRAASQRWLGPPAPVSVVRLDQIQVLPALFQILREHLLQAVTPRRH